MKDIIQLFDSIMRKWTPDPFVIAVALTGLVGILALIFTPAGLTEVTLSWGDGFWKLISFTLQMAMILLGGFLVASSPVVQLGLEKICGRITSPALAIIATTLIAGLASWLNWGFGLVVGAFLAVEMARQVPKANFRVLVASSYSGFLLWHGGLSGSIPLVVNTEGNFSQEWIGRVIPLSETLFSGFNITAVLGLIVLLPLTNWYLSRSVEDSEVEIKFPPAKLVAIPSEKNQTPAQKVENSYWVPVFLFAFALFYLFLIIRKDQFRLDLNAINFIFLFLGLILHWRTRSFLSAIKKGSEKLGPILIQYPLYAGIMGIMRETGLANRISDFFVNTSTQTSFPLFTFLGAGVVNFFVPSGGGQWAVQAPVVIPAAETLGVNIPLTVLAVAWGDAWTNMAQPFWALPLLAIAGLGAKDILGFTLTTLIISGLWLSTLFLIFA